MKTSSGRRTPLTSLPFHTNRSAPSIKPVIEDTGAESEEEEEEEEDPGKDDSGLRRVLSN